MTARLIQLNRQLNSPLNVTKLSPLHRDYFSPFWEKAREWPFTLMLITSRCAEVLISSSSKLAFPGTFPPWVVNSVQEEATVHIAHIMGVLLVTIVTRSYHGSHKKVLLPNTIETLTFPHISSYFQLQGSKTVLRPLCRDGSMLQLLSPFLHFLLF